MAQDKHIEQVTEQEIESVLLEIEEMLGVDKANLLRAALNGVEPYFVRRLDYLALMICPDCGGEHALRDECPADTFYFVKW